MQSSPNLKNIFQNSRSTTDIWYMTQEYLATDSKQSQALYLEHAG